MDSTSNSSYLISHTIDPTVISNVGSPASEYLSGREDRNHSEDDKQFLRPDNRSGSPLSVSSRRSSVSNCSRSGGNTFVTKLHEMLSDSQYHQYISWNPTGTSFIVCKVMEFSQEVLPKHFKHNNFSSFVRQLNMYGFHKVNKSPRGQRNAAENQIWEFMHPKFIRDRPDLLDKIRRKTMDGDVLRRDGSDYHSNVAVMQAHQSMYKEVSDLRSKLEAATAEILRMKSLLDNHHQILRTLLEHLKKSNSHIPAELQAIEALSISPQSPHPNILISNHDIVAPGNTGTSAAVIAASPHNGDLLSSAVSAQLSPVLSGSVVSMAPQLQLNGQTFASCANNPATAPSTSPMSDTLSFISNELQRQQSQFALHSANSSQVSLNIHSHSASPIPSPLLSAQHSRSSQDSMVPAHQGIEFLRPATDQQGFLSAGSPCGSPLPQSPLSSSYTEAQLSPNAFIPLGGSGEVGGGLSPHMQHSSAGPNQQQHGFSIQFYPQQ
ncbi:hypothetical protein EV182_000388 [Spiromyces aspiralis]|uniref:Uncharacterized protein n=1 Tax=Spiromyces aspiralis TaxID=68401 RepID=A0ACC1HWV5_9FUNG|nr:hypothetical protein EV182_000388 [Spiromyces aspiralis]